MDAHSSPGNCRCCVDIDAERGFRKRVVDVLGALPVSVWHREMSTVPLKRACLVKTCNFRESAFHSYFLGMLALDQSSPMDGMVLQKVPKRTERISRMFKIISTIDCVQTLWSLRISQELINSFN